MQKDQVEILVVGRSKMYPLSFEQSTLSFREWFFTFLFFIYFFHSLVTGAGINWTQIMLIDWHNLRLIVSSYFALGHKHVLSLLAAVCSTGHIRRRTLKNRSGVVWSTYYVAPGLIFRFDDFFYKFCPLSTDRSVYWYKCFTGINPILCF